MEDEKWQQLRNIGIVIIAHYRRSVVANYSDMYSYYFYRVFCYCNFCVKYENTTEIRDIYVDYQPVEN